MTVPAGGEPQLRPQTVQEAVLAEMRRRLVSGEWQPDAVIQLEEIARELDVSRIPIREALGVLVAEGRVVSKAHRSYRVAKLSADDLSELHELLTLAESAAVQFAAPRFDEILGPLEEAESELRAVSGEVEQFVRAFRRFRFTLLQASDHRHLTDAIDTLWSESDGYRVRFFHGVAARSDILAYSSAIVAAVRRGDPDAVIASLNEQRDWSVGKIKELIAADQAVGGH